MRLVLPYVGTSFLTGVLSVVDRIEAKREQVLRVLRATAGQGPITVGQVMTAKPYCVQQETSVPDLIRLFHTMRFRHLMVTDRENRLIGLVSDRDVLRCLGPAQRPKPETLAGITAGQIMSSDLVTIAPELPLQRAVVHMVDYGISCLPVVEQGRLVGIITNTDLHVLLRVLLENASHTPTRRPTVSRVN